MRSKGKSDQAMVVSFGRTLLTESESQCYPRIVFELPGDQEFGAGYGGQEAAEEEQQVQEDGGATGEQSQQSGGAQSSQRQD